MTFSRCSGVLLHIASLPGDYGIGVLGQEARTFVDWLRSAGQTLWQILPIGPTGYGNSPYQSYSSFAGNPYFIDPAGLVEMGLVTPAEAAAAQYAGDPTAVDYSWVEESRRALFSAALPRFRAKPPADYPAFCSAQAWWLEDYALFMAIKDETGGLPYTRWDADIRLRKKQALSMWRVKCDEGVAYYKMLQYLFYRQWADLKAYANRQGVRILGDIPIYVSPDSADVWANPHLFLLDEEGAPTQVAGCPPDLFSDDGQLWGNPVYDWKNLRRSGYRFWLLRLAACMKVYDILRIDHFRAFADYYCIPAGAENARTGQWRKGPGMDFIRAVRRRLGDIPLVAEDLGDLSPAVYELMADCGLPGMRVLQFAFDPDEDGEHLPHHHVKNGVVYTGTHDNNTVLGWAEENPEHAANARAYLGLDEDADLCRPLMTAALASVANVCVLTGQDLLGLGSEARMNTPSTLGGTNWCWRATEGSFTPETATWLLTKSRLYGRSPKPPKAKKTVKKESDHDETT